MLTTAMINILLHGRLTAHLPITKSSSIKYNYHPHSPISAPADVPPLGVSLAFYRTQQQRVDRTSLVPLPDTTLNLETSDKKVKINCQPFKF